MSQATSQIFGRYQVLGPLGAGGMAQVYKGYDPVLEREVAIKVVSGRQHDTASNERLRREARAIAALRHPNIVQIHDYGEHEGSHYMVMELVRGTDLGRHLLSLRSQNKQMSSAEAQNIIDQVAAGLDYAHAHCIVHRDIKPPNILLCDDGPVVLTDFGLVLRVEPGAQPTVGQTVGTPEYVSPEQMMDGAFATPRSDVYSLGVVLYLMLTGNLPFQSDNPIKTALMHINNPAPPPRQFNPELPPSVEAVILKAMSKEPGERYASAGEMARALRAAWGDKLVDPFTPHTRPRARRRNLPFRQALHRGWALIDRLASYAGEMARALRAAWGDLFTLHSQPRARRRNVSSRQALHRRLALIDRLAFYVFIVTLPFDLHISISQVSNTPMLLSRVCLLTALVLWLPVKLIEPCRKWHWGWWYAFVPLGLLLLLQVQQPMGEALLLVALYLFVVNELQESVYPEVGLVLVVAVVFQLMVTRGYIPGVTPIGTAHIAQLVSIQAFVPVGLAIAPRNWLARSAGLVVAAITIAATLAMYAKPSTGLMIIVFEMLIAWMIIRRRMWLQLALLIITLIVGVSVALRTGTSGLELFASASQSFQAWQSRGWVLAFLLVLPLLAASARVYLKKDANALFAVTIPGMFIVLLVVVSSGYITLLDSVGTWLQWLGLVFLTGLVFTSAVSLFGLKADLGSHDWPVVVGLLQSPLTKARLRLFGSQGHFEQMWILSSRVGRLDFAAALPVVASWLALGGLALVASPLLFAIPLLVVSSEIKNKALGNCLSFLLVWLSFLIALSSLAMVVGLGFIFTNSAMSWIARILIGFLVLALGWMIGLAVALSLKADLNIGCGGLVLMVAMVAVTLAVVTRSPSIAYEQWPLILGTVVAISAWRSQRMWTVIMAGSLIGVCVLALAEPFTWLAAPQSALLVSLMGLWVDKNNILSRHSRRPADGAPPDDATPHVHASLGR